MPWLLEELPETLRTALVHGTEGAGHLRGCARLAAQAGLARLSGELLLSAWAQSPLDAVLAGEAASLPDIPASVRAVAAFVADNSRPPADLGYYQRLAQRREAAKIAHYLERQLESDPGNLFWERLSLTHAQDAEDWAAAGAVIARLPEPLARLLGGDAAMMRGAPEAALANYARCVRLWECPGLKVRLGLTCVALGQRGEAESWLRAGLTHEPWQVHALLALYDLLFAGPGLRSLPEGDTVILLYTWNKAQDIGLTLESLAASDLGRAHIIVLDNGSTDDTAQVLASWGGKLGPERFSTVSLPVNVGAPAARNWLVSLPVVKESQWTVFLDDDVSLPPDWLGLLGAAAGLYPQAVVWGARVRDFSRPAHVQSADVFLDASFESIGAREAGEGRHFTLSSCHHQTLDRGQFAYIRPCATVTGCCHMFRTATLAGQGGFDLRYSPSQYDDLDHDIRLLLSGRTPVYQGHLAVGHFKSTGSQGGVGQAQYGVGWANQYKLHQKFDPDAFRRAASVADRAAWEDALAKWRSLMAQ
ncbi:MAG: glycosyl transferase group 2 family [Desulfovibrionaceae bacterium]|nr:MAG: glycosyl transferase group 2 family [Desulfovibrionaceae bacterium]